jgi:hypothetical protein
MLIKVRDAYAFIDVVTDVEEIFKHFRKTEHFIFLACGM